MSRAAVITIVVFAVIIGSCSAPYLLHDYALTRVRHEYRQIKHPTSSSGLETVSQVGLLIGNGNHCDYFVGEIRESDEPADQIREYYARFSVPMMDPAASQWGPAPNYPITVEFPDQRGKIDPSVDDMSEALRRARARQTKKTLYVVYLLDGGYEPNFDLRCH
jgi:hypothetical protein